MVFRARDHGRPEGLDVPAARSERRATGRERDVTASGSCVGGGDPCVTTSERRASARAASGVARAAASSRPLLRAAVAVLTAAAGALGCGLDVDDPDVVTPDDLEGPAGAATLFAGAIGDMALAYGGDAGVREGQILVAGLLADEFVHSGNFASRRAYDRRAVTEDNETAVVPFANLHRARRAAEEAAAAFRDLPGDDPREGEAWALAGFAYAMFAETYCSGVPFSEIVDGRLEPGPPLPTDAIFERALARFDEASAAATGDAEVLALARVGRGRALLGLGRFDEAAAAVAGVPTDFVHELERSQSSAERENGVHAFTIVYERWSVADGEGGAGLPFRSAADPRVPWERTPPDDVGFDFSTPQYDQLKYPARDSPLPLATGEEARLIEAEAALAAGDPEGMLAALNEVRARHGLDALEDPGGEARRREMLFRERAFTLFATGRRLGDLRRLVRWWGADPDEVFPTGAYHGGGSYGTDVNLPVPEAERVNPLFHGCLDRAP